MTASAPAAIVGGRELEELPQSLYVHPEALRVMLDGFDGPLDLLHYLIKRNNIDILDIPMADITRQYLAYVDRIVESQIELAADYLLMSAILIEIKSRMLLPQQQDSDDETAEDPRAELIHRLLAYSRIKEAAAALGKRPRRGRDFMYASIALPPAPARKPSMTASSLAAALLSARERTAEQSTLDIQADTYTVREAMVHLLTQLRVMGKSLFSRLLGSAHASRHRISVCFIAALQLVKEQLVYVEQANDDELAIRPRSKENSNDS